MKKVLQTVTGEQGNCMQAAIASIFELELDEVPDFANVHEKNKYYGYSGVRAFGEGHGLEMDIVWNPHYKEVPPHRRHEYIVSHQRLLEVLSGNDVHGGFFYASVPSPNIEGNHAVVVDRDMKIAHDPHPNQKALSYGPAHVEAIVLFQPMDDGQD